MAWPKSGHDAYIYISGEALVGGNAWSLDIPSETVEHRLFGDDWVTRDKSFNDWSGSIDAEDDVKLLTDCALAAGSLPLYIYPDRGTTGEYFSGNAIFGANSGGSTTSAVTVGASFVGDDTLTVTGFA